MQLPLAIEFPESATLDSFIPGANTLLLELLRNIARGEGEAQLYIWSATGMGKTHLLQATCRMAADNGRKTCYLPFDVMQQHGPNILDGLEMLDLVALDDLQRIVRIDGWQQAVFSLINRCRAASTAIVFAASASTAELDLQLRDLESRLAWGPIFELRELADEDKLKVLQARAGKRSLELSDETGRYLLSRYPRDMRYLCDTLDRLDRASLAAQRRLTIPFIKTVLSHQ